jgi:hypothetical protein
MKRLALILALGGILAGCGGGTNGKTEVLRPTDPEVSGLYFSIQGPAKSVDAVAKLFRTRLSAHTKLTTTSTVHGKKDCSVTRKVEGKTVTVALYGSNSHAQALCQHLDQGFAGSHGAK